MPGVLQMRVREAVDEARRAYDAGIRAVLLFGLPEYEGRHRLVVVGSDRAGAVGDRGDQARTCRR